MYPDLLVIPVHKGGEFLTQALESLLPILDRFPRVVISLNSPDNRADMVRVLAVFGSGRYNVEIFETPQVLSAVRHLKWLFSHHLRQSAAKNVMLLFHDDRLEATTFDSFARNNDVSGGLAYFGGWRLSRDGIEVGISKVGIKPAGESPTEWFTREDLSREKQHVYTNASGLIIPIEAMRSFIGWVPLARGARFEHMLVSHRSVKRLITAEDPFLIVSRHANQDGGNVPLIQSLTDEIVYQMWMFANGRRVKPRALVYGAVQVFLATASLLAQLLYRILGVGKSN